MLPEVIHRPWPAGLIALLSACLVVVQTLPEPEWLVAAWVGPLIYCTVVGGRQGTFLQRHLTRPPDTLAEFAIGFAAIAPWFIFMFRADSPLAAFAPGLWYGRWLRPKDVHGRGAVATIMLGAFSGIFYAMAASRTGSDVHWGTMALIVGSTCFLVATTPTRYARYIRPALEKGGFRVLLLVVVATLISGPAAGGPASMPGAQVLVAAVGFWCARWFLADPAIDAEADPTCPIALKHSG